MEIKKNPVLKTSEENLVEISWPKIWTWIYAGLRPIVHMGFRSPSARFNSGTLPRWGTGIPRWKRIAPPVLTSWGQVLSGLGRRRRIRWQGSSMLPPYRKATCWRHRHRSSPPVRLSFAALRSGPLAGRESTASETTEPMFARSCDSGVISLVYVFFFERWSWCMWRLINSRAHGLSIFFLL